MNLKKGLSRCHGRRKVGMQRVKEKRTLFGWVLMAQPGTVTNGTAVPKRRGRSLAPSRAAAAWRGGVVVGIGGGGERSRAGGSGDGYLRLHGTGAGRRVGDGNGFAVRAATQVGGRRCPSPRARWRRRPRLRAGAGWSCVGSHARVAWPLASPARGGEAALWYASAAGAETRAVRRRRATGSRGRGRIPLLDRISRESRL